MVLRAPLDFRGGSAAPQAFPARREILLALSAVPLSSAFGQHLNECPRGNFGPTVMKRPTLWATCNTPTYPPGESPSWLIWEIDNWIYQFGADAPPTSAIRRIVELFASKLVAVSATSSAATAHRPSTRQTSGSGGAAVASRRLSPSATPVS